MRKQYILLIILIVVLIIICLLGRSLIMENNKEKELKEYEATLELVKDINQNSDFFGLELLKFSDKSVQSQPSKGAYDIAPLDGEVAAEGGVEGYYLNYPKDSNDYRLAQISINIMPYHVFGITVGHNINDIIPILEEKGFYEDEINSDYDVDYVIYRQHHVTINFNVNKDTRVIRAITISVYDKEDAAVLH